MNSSTANTLSSENATIRRMFLNLPHMDANFLRKVFAEALGSFILMFCIAGIIANLHFMENHNGLIEYAATAGLAVIVIAFSIGPISGAHVNPAATIAFALVGPFPWSQVPFYLVAQFAGSFLATFVGKLIYGINSEILMTKPLQGVAAAFWSELFTTFLILFLITSLISTEGDQPTMKSELTGIVCGVSIGLGVLMTGPVSGASLNPARSLGPALVSGKFEDLWIYLVAPTIGAIVGVAASRILRLEGWNCKSDHPQAPPHANNNPLN